jgi:hypothetical protein
VRDDRPVIRIVGYKAQKNQDRHRQQNDGGNFIPSRMSFQGYFFFNFDCHYLYWERRHLACVECSAFIKVSVLVNVDYEEKL